MLQRLKQWLSLEGPQVDTALLLRKAAALLMIEVAKADDDFDAAERQVLLSNIAQAYQLSEPECQALLTLVERESEELLSMHSLTRLLVEEASLAQRQELVLQLWRVAYADGRIDRYEEHIIRRIADLLYVPHAGFIQAKLDAQTA